MARKIRNPKRTPLAGLPERSEDGVDLTLIRWMLSLTPAGRLRAAQSTARSLMRLRSRPSTLTSCIPAVPGTSSASSKPWNL
jgi:hypothetical protein